MADFTYTLEVEILPCDWQEFVCAVVIMAGGEPIGVYLITEAELEAAE